MNITFIYRKFRKSIAGIALTALLASFVSFAAVASASFPDTDGHWAADYIDELVSQSVVSGYDNGNFGPDDSLTRGQLAKIAVLAFDIELDSSHDAGFADVDSSAWHADYVNTAAKNGIVGGYTDADGVATGYFGPDDTVNRAQAAKILVNAAGLSTDTTDAPHFDDVALGDWYYDYVETAYNNSVVDGYSDGNYGPADAVTRGQISKMTVNSQNPVARDDSSDDDTSDDDTSSAGEGSLKLELVSIDGGTVPKGATAVTVIGIMATASGDDTTLASLVLSRTGVGATTDISNLYFYNESTRIGSGHSVSSDSNTATFNSLDVDVAEGESVMFYIKADFATGASAGNEHIFSIASADVVEVDAGTVSGSYPIDGDTFTIGGASAGTITISKSSSVSNPTIGETDAIIADFKLEAANENVNVEHIALIAKGTVSSTGLENLSLVQNGEVLATATSVDDNQLITFDLDTPFELDKGDSRTFSVTSEVTSKARPDDTIKIYLDESTDLVAIGETYGYGATVTRTAYDNGANDGTDANWSTVQGGDFTIAFGGPSVANFAPNAKNIQVLDVTFSSARDVEVRRLGFDLNAALGEGLISTTANYTDIKLVDTDSGSTLMGPLELSTTGHDTTQTISFTDSWYISEGESVNASLTLDVANLPALDADTIKATLNAVSTTDGVKDTGTGQFLTNIVPSSALAGYTHNIQTASLAVALASSPVSDTFVKGTAGVTLAGFVFTAGAASDVTITKLLPTLDYCTSGCTEAGSWSASGSSGAFFGKTDVGTLYLYDEDGNQLGSAEAVPNAGKPTFDGFNLLIAAGSTETVYVVGDVSSSAPIDGATDVVGVDIEATGDITAVDEDDNTVTLTAADPNGSTDTNATTVAMTISSGGSIVVSAPSTQVNDQLIAAAASDVLLGRFKVKATSEDFKVDRIVLYANNATASDSTPDGASATHSQDSFRSVKIKFPTSTSAPTTLDGSSSATFSGTSATFANLSFMVPKSNDNVTFEVYVTANSHADDSGASDSGDDLQMTLYPYAATTSTNAFNAVGQGSGATSDADDAGVIAAAGLPTNHAYLFKTIPTVTVSDTSAAIVYGAEAEVFRFTVAAGSNGDMALLGLKFDASSSGVLTGSTGLGGADAAVSRNDPTGTSNVWKAYEVVSGSVDSSIPVGSGTYLHTNTAVGFTAPLVYMQIYKSITTWAAGTGEIAKISSGTSKTFVIVAPVVDDGVSNTNSISVRIATDNAALHQQLVEDTIASAQAGALASSSFIWSDRPNVSGFGTGSSATYWNNAYKVSGIPSSYVTST